MSVEMAGPRPKRASGKTTVVTIAAAVAGLLGLLISAVAIDQRLVRHNLLANYQERMVTVTDVRRQLIVDQIGSLRGDALFLAAIPPVEGMIRAIGDNGIDAAERTSEHSWRHRLEETFTAYLASNPQLNEIRFIGVADRGRELVRVERQANAIVTAPQEGLATQGDRSYFTAALKLRPGQAYVSDLELNQRSEGPSTSPTLRAAAPVFDPDGKTVGAIVVNMDATWVLRRLQANIFNKYQVYLMNGEGGILLGPSRDFTIGGAPGAVRRWRDHFASVAPESAAERGFRNYRTADGDILHAIERRIPLDPQDPSRFLGLSVGLPDSAIAPDVNASAATVILFATLGAALAGGLFGLYRLQLDRADRRRRQLAALVEGSVDAMICETLDGIVTYWNSAAEKMFGYSSGDATGRALVDLIIPDELGAEEAEILAVIKTGRPLRHFETRRCRDDGSVIDVSVAVSPLYSTSGEVVGASKILRDISEQKAKDAALADAQERLQVTTRSNGIGIWDLDPATGIVRWDEAMYELHGLRREDVTDLYGTWRSLVDPQDLAAAEAVVETAMETGVPLDTSFRITTPAGEQRYIQARVAARLDPSGRVRSVLGTNLDITAQKRREMEIEHLNATLELQVAARTAQLKSLTALQRAAVADSAYPIIATDLAGIITIFNPAAERMLGYTAEELIGKATPRIFSRDEDGAAAAQRASGASDPGARSMLDVFVAMLEDAPKAEGEWTFIRKDGSSIPILLTGSAMRDEDGRVLGYLGLVLDLRERAKFEQTLKENEQFLRQITDNIPAIVSYWDRRLVCRFANDKSRAWFRKDGSDVEGMELKDLVTPAEADVLMYHANGALAGRIQRFEFSTLRGDGGLGWAACQFVPDVRDGSVQGFYALAWDMTKLKRIQVDLETANQTLAARTSQAEAATIAKSQFLANMSHEIRSPMNAILGMLQLLMMTTLSDRQREYATKARSATQSLLYLLNDILDFSKIEAGKIALETAPFNIDAMMRDVSSLVTAGIDDKPVEVVFAIDPQLLSLGLRGDAFRLRQVLLNLVGNAVKFTPRGEVLVAVRLVARDADVCTIEFVVQDTGIGIDGDQLQAIFESFVQAEASTARKFGGSGLGLAISQKLISLMGGELRVESTLGLGSVFGFSLSFETDALGVRADKLGALTAETTGEHKNVLVVDDNEHAREALAAVVRSLAWSCDTAASGAEALAKIGARPAGEDYDVILMDWLMPEMDGWETSHQLRQLPGRRKAPIIVMVSARDREELSFRSQSRPGLVNGVLVKPVTPSMVLGAVIDSSDLGGAADEPGSAPGTARPLAGLRILVVDDTTVNRQIGQELLAFRGARVEVAEEGMEAIEKVLAAVPPFDVVLMDIQMPVMDGYETTRRLRQSGRVGSLPIIAMTANAMASDKQACLEAGMDDHIPKPIDIDVVVATILAHCGNPAPVSGSEDLPICEKPAVSPLIDLDLALARLGNNRGLFAKISAQFIHDSVELMDELRRSVHDGAVQEAMAILHTARGLAAAVGNAPFAHIAGQMEKLLAVTGQLYEPESDLDLLASLLLAGNKAIQEWLEEFAGTMVAVPPIAPADRDVIRAQLDELEYLLDTSNIRALEVCEGLRHDVGMDYATELLPTLDAVGRLDFRLARVELTRLRKVLT